MKLGRTLAVALSGLEGTLVETEAHIAQGLPHFGITGLPDKACSQAPDRVRSALQSIGQQIPTQRVVVNLSPASVAKAGTGFDLAIAIALLSADRVVGQAHCGSILHMGELGLDGRIKGVHGVLPAVLAAARAGVRHVVVPPANAAEAQLVDGVVVHAPPDLATLVQWYVGCRQGGSLPVAEPAGVGGGSGAVSPDLADVVGQDEARLALELAAAGGHHLHLTGPPGAGKTMLAERLVTVLPPLRREEALQTHAIRSLTGGLAPDTDLDLTPPFVAPHHNASQAAIIGGGSSAITPGAISRAHLGVLFLDEAPEFKATVLDTLRQPLESGEVVIARARQVVRYPARFLLVLASNPCRCGRAWGKGADCQCSPLELRRYQQRLSGPLMDRVDLQVTVPPVHRAAFGDQRGEASEMVATRVLIAREIQEHRWRSRGWALNGEAPGHALRRPPFRLPGSATASVDRSIDRGTLTLRGYDRVLRVAWSVADISGHTSPTADDVDLALTLRLGGQVAA